MVDKEMLQAMAELLDSKFEPINSRLDALDDKFTGLDATVSDMRQDITRLGDKVTLISVTLENEIRPNIQLLAENYVPAAKRYEKASDKIEFVAADIDILKKVVTGHSEKLQKIS